MIDKTALKGHITSKRFRTTGAGVLGLLQKIIENLLKSESLVCSVVPKTRTALCIFQFWLNYLEAYFFKELAYTFARSLRKEMRR